MTPAGDFKWNGSIHGSKVLTISTLRLTIVQLENNVPAPFMHPNWASHRWACEPGWFHWERWTWFSHADATLSK